MKHEKRRLQSLLAGLTLVAALFNQALAAPTADPWPYWEKQNAGSTKVIDHADWTKFLQKYVKAADTQGLHRVDYGGVSTADKKSLDGYLKQLQSLDITQHNRKEQLAYWLNLYNAATVDLVVEHYPVDSIRGILGGLFNSGPWDEKILTVEGIKLSLNDVEHRILRPIWNSPLIHYGVNCASIGCPNLLQEAFTADDTQSKLKANARAFINSPRGVALDDGNLTVSSIYKWFQVDFGGSESGVIGHLRDHAAPGLKKALTGRVAIDDYDYDWSLNDK